MIAGHHTRGQSWRRCIYPLMGLAALMLMPPGRSAMDPGIGRLERTPRRCITSTPARQEHPCRALRLDRKSDHVLRARFIGITDAKGLTQSISFVSTDPTTPLPLTCRQGRCALEQTTWNGSVIGVSESQTNALGISEELPKAWPARGQCSISLGRIVCSARLSNGGTIRGDAKF